MTDLPKDLRRKCERLASQYQWPSRSYFLLGCEAIYKLLAERIEVLQDENADCWSVIRERGERIAALEGELKASRKNTAEFARDQLAWTEKLQRYERALERIASSSMMGIMVTIAREALGRKEGE